jgi:hypothetical protein
MGCGVRHPHPASQQLQDSATREAIALVDANITWNNSLNIANALSRPKQYMLINYLYR